jgi:2-polyprenyl-3-methyl-5-hydroxy-6-metoxy-1,4-benzoquinol methylase
VKKELQYGFSAVYGDTSFARQVRERKAAKVLAILEDAVGGLSEMRLLDIGCSTGFMTKCYAKKFGEVVGTDIDHPAVCHAATSEAGQDGVWGVADSQRLPFRDEYFDVVTCTHIYEHVPDANLLMAEIFRVLRPNGVCFFSAGNRLSLIEPHYRLPLLSVLPKFLAHWYLRMLGRGANYYETHFSYWGLKRLVRRFYVEDYTLKVVADPQKFFAEDMIRLGSFKQKLVVMILRVAYWICPTYLWVLRKYS